MINPQLNHKINKALLRAYPVLKYLLPNAYVLYNLRGGKTYLNVRESQMMFARTLGLYETEKMDLVAQNLKAGATFVDVGANKGDFTLLASGLVGKAGHVIAVEPESTNCGWIRRSLKMNECGNVILNEAALSNRNGVATLYLGEKSGWHTLLRITNRNSKGEVQVNVRTLDGLLRELRHTTVDMIKIDVEGAELEVLEGASECLATNERVVLLIDIHPHLRVDPYEVLGFLRSRRFSVFAMTKLHGKYSSVGPETEELFAFRDNTIV